MRTASALLIVAIAAGCSGAADDDLDTEATERPTATPTEAPWSDAFEDGLCLAIEEFPSLQSDMEDLQAAASEIDVEGVIDAAGSALATTRSIDAELETIASEYPPSRALMVAWRRANRSLIAAFEDIEEGAEELDIKQINRGSARLADASELIEVTTPLIEEFAAETGFECP